MSNNICSAWERLRRVRRKYRCPDKVFDSQPLLTAIEVHPVALQFTALPGTTSLSPFNCHIVWPGATTTYTATYASPGHILYKPGVPYWLQAMVLTPVNKTDSV